MVVVLKCENNLVTDWYMEMLGEALQEIGEDIVYVDKIDKVLKYPKTSIIVVARILDALTLNLKGYKRNIMWFQGVEPEESLMRNNSKIRFWILSKIEKIVLKKAKFSLFVSNEMANHYKTKYKIDLDKKKYYCMPCQNTGIHKFAFQQPDKYKDNVFAYIGSLAVWQKFEETVECYVKCEKIGLPNTKLVVYTSEGEKAEKILQDKGVRNYIVDFVPNEKLHEKLKNVKYGFIIRDDNIVNRVATPTKISTYLSCGLIPIYSDVLKDFSHIAEELKYAVLYDEKLEQRLLQLNSEKIKNEDVLEEYNTVFETYYNKELHKKNLINMLSECMKY